MTGAAVALVLCSAFLHALWNRYLHRSEDRVTVMGLAYLSGGLFLVPWLLADPPTAVLGWLLLAIVLHTAYQILLTTSYAEGGLSITYPIARGISPVLVAAGGWLLLDQTLSRQTLLGIGLVSVGLLALAAVGLRAAQREAVVLAAFTGVAVTAYTLVDARAVQEADPTGYLAAVGVGAGLAVLATNPGAARRARHVVRSGLIVGVMQTGSYLLLLFALQRAQAAQVASLRQVSVFIGVVLAGEAFRRQTYVAAAFVAAGAVLIAW